VAEAFAAASVGAKASTRAGWASLRSAQKLGRHVHGVAERVREAQDSSLVYDPATGGWSQSSAPWAGPGGASVNNRNLRVATTPPESERNPFESRIFGSAGGSHYAVADRSDETYAYSGARGIFKKVDAASHVPAHYKTALAQKPSAEFKPSHYAPGSNIPLKGGWPLQPNYGELPKSGQYGWSIEKGVGEKGGSKQSSRDYLASVTPSG
jgi:hypothetical protein